MAARNHDDFGGHVSFSHIPRIAVQFSAAATLLIATPVALPQAPGFDLAKDLYQTHCSVCHGEQFEGAAQGGSLLGELRHGETMKDVVTSIANGYEATGMPAWKESLSAADINNLALLVTEQRTSAVYSTFHYDSPVVIPRGPLKSNLHDFRLEVVADGLDALPFSIAPLPDGRFLVTEKKRGLRIVTADGSKSALIEGTPRVFDDTFVPTMNQEIGWGWMFDVVTHPKYVENGWVYLMYGDRCRNCNELSRGKNARVSMNKIVRGRIDQGRWKDEEVIFEADREHYGTVPDIAAGGRMTFDDRGRLYFSVGIKGFDNHSGVLDLSTPWGKIHRINDDGTIPSDNPYATHNNAYKSIYSFGHRNPQGLEYRADRGELWSTEMGPRGGDELNLIKRGRNYGWPLLSRGMNYDGTPVEYGKKLGIAFELAEIEQPVADFSPAPALGSFVIYEGSRFPKWSGQFLITSLKARSLYRVKVAAGREVERETLIEGLARIRDIEVARNGDIVLLLENNSGAKIVRMTAD